MHLSVAKKAAIESGNILLEYLGNVREIDTKNDQKFNLVTEADREAERCIINVVRHHYPNDSILAEEGGAVSGNSDYRWIIDPLDGTTNFLHGLSVFCISIGVEYKGEIVAGVIYNPASGELFHCEKNRGSYLNGKRIFVSETKDLERSLLATGFPYNVGDNPDHCLQRLNAFVLEAHGIRRLGSAAIDCAFVACGRFDGFWEIWLHPWDVAAGGLLIREAGGRTSDFYGNDHSIYKPQFLGSNGHLHDRMISILKRSENTETITF